MKVGSCVQRFPHLPDFMTHRPTILLHVCCAPCATAPIERLRAEFDVSLFFSNSNVWPPEEYDGRLAAARGLAARLGLPLTADAYDHTGWLAHIRGLEQEPEEGKRCEKCFEFNLARAAAHAREHGFGLFTTTLTVSPRKRSAVIFRIGKAQGPFLKYDFKKQGGFQRNAVLSRLYGLYRQDYCGCEFSDCSRSSRLSRPLEGPAR
ncbi:MAG: epoxyqueuosine reductase QueH [Verrucomicrobiota bacterium]|nr:epoxyqueuosine reductase QueH [Verrucomicrobiota bacterium]